LKADLQTVAAGEIMASSNNGESRGNQRVVHMSIYDNPSAGKFESPSPPPEPAAERSFNPLLLSLLLVALLVLATYWLRTAFPGRSWASLISALLAFGLGTLDVFLKRKRDDESEAKKPYSPPTSITR
jgi:hypothetical protein